MFVESYTNSLFFRIYSDYYPSEEWGIGVTFPAFNTHPWGGGVHIFVSISWRNKEYLIIR